MKLDLNPELITVLRSEHRALRKLVERGLVIVAAIRLTDADDHLPPMLDQEITNWTRRAKKVYGAGDADTSDAG